MVAAGAVLASRVTAQSVAYLGGFSATNAAFLDLARFQGGEYALIISEFTGDPLAGDGVASVLNVASTLGNVNATVPTAITSSLVWPNEVNQVTSGFGTFSGLLEAGGFLVPPKCVGGINFIDMSPDGSNVTHISKISQDDGNALFGGYFYHRGVVRDVDGDGYDDVLAARAIKPLFGNGAGELVWFRQPPGVSDPLDPSLLPWANYTLMSGANSPDIFIALANLRNDADEQLLYASFFTGGGLGIIVCPGCAGAGAKNTWSNVSSLQQIMIDPSIGPGFDVVVVDLNGDGRLDLLVTNHVDNATLSGVFAYEAPPAGVPITRVSAWTKHVLYVGFVVREPGPNQASPGAARPLLRCTSSPLKKPLISVAGDGDQRVYLLTPVSDAPTNWAYSLTEIFDCKGTVGRQISADVDGDGCQELFVPCYDVSTIQVFRVLPGA